MIVDAEELSFIMASNTNLHQALKAKKDEFYTQLSDIENELCHYREHFKGKTVLCNCDDPRVSNFSVYFVLNFKALGLKRLITTCYKNNEPDLFSQNECDRAVYAIYDGTPECNSVEDAKQIPYMEFEHSDGDFRSDECIELLKQADIVVTNPPFSLFREYIAQLFKYNKKFLIIGNINAITYKEVFPLIYTNQMWIGYGFNVSMVYRASYENHSESNRKYVKAKGYNPDDNYIVVPSVAWFTNLDIAKRHENLILYKAYSNELYPKLDNYNAINVNKVSEIPSDYSGIMAVPITFLDKYNPTQFQIVGMAAGNSAVNNFGLAACYKRHPNDRGGCGVVKGERLYARLLIRKTK